MNRHGEFPARIRLARFTHTDRSPQSGTHQNLFSPPDLKILWLTPESRIKYGPPLMGQQLRPRVKRKARIRRVKRLKQRRNEAKKTKASSKSA